MGHIVLQDDVEAARWYQLAAEQGVVDAQLRLAKICQEGLGLPKNEQLASEWYLRATQAILEQEHSAEETNEGES